MMDGFFGMGVTGWFLMAVFWVAVVGLIVLAARNLSEPSHHGAGTTPMQPTAPQDMLKSRYARGEITREQYQQMLDDLAA